MMLRFVLLLGLSLVLIISWQAHESARTCQHNRKGCIDSKWLKLTMLMQGLTHLSQTIAEGKTITGDLGGKATTSEYTSAIIEKLGKA